MIYEYQCYVCQINWTRHCSVEDRNKPEPCPECGEPGIRIVSAIPSYFHYTHPDVKQDMHELVAGEPPGNLLEY